MKRSALADTLRRAILSAFEEAVRRHPTETPYAFALLAGPSGRHLGYAVATEQGLLRVAEEYDRLGYRYQPEGWEGSDNRERLATWLRWANPDDGWERGEFPESSGVHPALGRALDHCEIGGDGEGLEEFCTGVLASLGDRSAPAGSDAMRGLGAVVVGFTYGSDPRDFLRTATRANAYPLVRRLWVEWNERDEVERRIECVG